MHNMLQKKIHKYTTGRLWGTCCGMATLHAILSEDVNKAMDVNEKEIDRLNAEVEEIREHVKSAEIKHKTSVSKIKALESSVFQGRAFSAKPSQVLSVQRASTPYLLQLPKTGS